MRALALIALTACNFTTNDGDPIVTTTPHPQPVQNRYDVGANEASVIAIAAAP